MAAASEGPSTDRHNDPVVDPSKNVLDLVDAAIERQDDLRNKEGAHVREILSLRAQHDRELRGAEAARLDAIREVDAENARAATAAAEVRATALAATVTATAEANRSQVEAARAATADALAAALAPITSAIEQLRQAMYEDQGQKTQVVEGRSEGMSQTAKTMAAIASVAVFLSFTGILVTFGIAALVTHGFTK